MTHVFQLSVRGEVVKEVPSFIDALDYLTDKYPEAKHLFGKGVSIRQVDKEDNRLHYAQQNCKKLH